jgi:outer membrane lipoprotein-sorting protein
VITFTKMELNTPIAPEEFNFKPPAGADVLKQ